MSHGISIQMYLDIQVRRGTVMNNVIGQYTRKDVLFYRHSMRGQKLKYVP